MTSAALSQNKASFKAYVQLFPECREVVALKRQQRLNKAREQQTSTTATLSTTGVTAAGRARSSTAATVAPLLRRNVSPQHILAVISRSLANRKQSSTPNIPVTRTQTATTQVPAVRNLHVTPSQSPDTSDEEMCLVADKAEKQIGIYKIK